MFITLLTNQRSFQCKIERYIRFPLLAKIILLLKYLYVLFCFLLYYSVEIIVFSLVKLSVLTSFFFYFTKVLLLRLEDTDSFVRSSWEHLSSLISTEKTPVLYRNYPSPKIHIRYIIILLTDVQYNILFTSKVTIIIVYSLFYIIFLK